MGAACGKNKDHVGGLDSRKETERQTAAKRLLDKEKAEQAEKNRLEQEAIKLKAQQEKLAEEMKAAQETEEKQRIE
jgi:hypothetical protein